VERDGGRGGLNTSYLVCLVLQRQDFGSARRPIIAMSPFAGFYSLLTTDGGRIRNNVESRGRGLAMEA
jgi:hypothetical protein